MASPELLIIDDPAFAESEAERKAMCAFYEERLARRLQRAFEGRRMTPYQRKHPLYLKPKPQGFG